MNPNALRRPPLVEAIFELRYRFDDADQPLRPPAKVDPELGLFVGLLYGALRRRYPQSAKLPAANLPPELAPQQVMHQFREEGGWPLVQVGPGILTLNMTTEYQRDDFLERADELVAAMWAQHPLRERITMTQVVLRYIDAVEYDYQQEDIAKCLADLGVEFGVDSPVLQEVGAETRPAALDIRSAYDLAVVRGRLELHYGMGVKQGVPALLWETIVSAEGDSTPGEPAGLATWLRTAHGVTHNWFFSSVRGNLEDELTKENGG